MTVVNQVAAHLFLCSHGRMIPRWSEAFSAAKAGKIHSARGNARTGKADLVWLRLEHGVPVALQIESLAPQLRRLPCVVLSDLPTDEEALAAFAAGARGYCNAHAAAQLLVQVAAVVLQGGLWIGESLMQRLLSATSRLQPAIDMAVLPEGETGLKT
jgi:two-component system nitrate/nitrite response regulator NarL